MRMIIKTCPRCGGDLFFYQIEVDHLTPVLTDKCPNCGLEIAGNKIKKGKKGMIVVNLFGAPGAGKSTGAAYLFSTLKFLGINAELVTEFAKDKVWEESVEVFKNQAYIFGKQSFRLSRIKDKIDVAITDSPLWLSAYYNTDPILGMNFNNLVKDVFDSYNNLNYYINRVKNYNPIGRFQTEEESDKIGNDLKEFLTQNKVPFKVFNGNIEGYDSIAREIMDKLKK